MHNDFKKPGRVANAWANFATGCFFFGMSVVILAVPTILIIVILKLIGVMN